MPMPFKPVPVLPPANAPLSSIPASSPVQAGFAHGRIAGDGGSEYGSRPKPRILRVIGRGNAAGLSTVMTLPGSSEPKKEASRPGTWLGRPRGSPVGTPCRVPLFRETGAWAPHFPGVLHRRVVYVHARSRILFPAHGDFPVRCSSRASLCRHANRRTSRNPPPVNRSRSSIRNGLRAASPVIYKGGTVRNCIGFHIRPRGGGPWSKRRKSAETAAATGSCPS